MSQNIFFTVALVTILVVGYNGYQRYYTLPITTTSEQIESILPFLSGVNDTSVAEMLNISITKVLQKEPWEEARAKGKLVAVMNTLINSTQQTIKGPYYTSLDLGGLNYTTEVMDKIGNEITIFFYDGNETTFGGVISYDITQRIVLPEQLKQPMKLYTVPDSVQMYLGEPTNPKYSANTTFAKAIISNAKTPGEAIILLRDYVYNNTPVENLIRKEYCILFSEYGEPLYRAAGFPTRIARGYLASDEIGKFETDISHVWLEVWVGNWVKIDTLHLDLDTERLISYSVGNKVHRYDDPLKIKDEESKIEYKGVWRISETEFRVEYIISSP